MKKAIIFTVMMLCGVLFAISPHLYAEEVVVKSCVLVKDHKTKHLNGKIKEAGCFSIYITNTGACKAMYKVLYRLKNKGWYIARGEIDPGETKSFKGLEGLKKHMITLRSIAEPPENLNCYKWAYKRFYEWYFDMPLLIPGAEVRAEICCEEKSLDLHKHVF